MNEPRIAILVPCFNEELAISRVIGGFRSALPQATVHVYDNNSTDRTAEAATAAGAQVRREPRQGKGYVVRRMFADIDADIYVLVDGDNTYDAASAPRMIEKLVNDNLDMVVGTRVVAKGGQAGAPYRPGHRFGNWLFTAVVGSLFGDRFSDILSGYRVFSRRFVKSFPSLSAGFEIETELTIHSLDLCLPADEIETPYSARAEGSESKLNSISDGFRILGMILLLLKETRPLRFFFSLFVLFSILSISLAAPLFITFLDTGLVPRFPTAILTTGIMLLGFLCLICGVILDSVSRGRREAKLLRYLSYPAMGDGSED